MPEASYLEYEKNQSTDESLPIDWESLAGKFGWASIDKHNIPYIIRKSKKYACCRIALTKLAEKFKQYYYPEINSCTDFPKYPVTDAETKLLDEINMFHCNGLYGNGNFTRQDQLLELDHLRQLYEFFSFVESACKGCIDIEKSPCGFIQIDAQPPVPFVVMNEEKYAPLFYFEGAGQLLDDRAVPLTGINFSYLKFCCQIQGIRQEYYNEECKVVEFEHVKKFFPDETKYEFIWPKNLMAAYLKKVKDENEKRLKAKKQVIIKQSCSQVQQVNYQSNNLPLPNESAISKETQSNLLNMYINTYPATNIYDQQIYAQQMQYMRQNFSAQQKR